MSSHPQRYEKCARCSKVCYPTWREAVRAAKDFMRLSGKTSGVSPYFSRPCRAIHLGHATDSAYRRAKGFK